MKLLLINQQYNPLRADLITIYLNTLDVLLHSQNVSVIKKYILIA